MSEVTYFLRMSISSLRSASDLRRRQLLACLAQELLLARRPHQVVVVVAIADVLERVVAAHPLVAGRDVDLRVLLGGRQAEVRVVVVVVDVDVDAVDRVDGVGEAVEVDVDDVVDVVQAGELLDDLQRQLRAPVAVGGVELVDPVAGDVDLQVARDRQDRDLVGGDPQQDRRVRAARTASVGRSSEPRIRIVCGLPGSATSSWLEPTAGRQALARCPSGRRAG